MSEEQSNALPQRGSWAPGRSGSGIVNPAGRGVGMRPPPLSPPMRATSETRRSIPTPLSQPANNTASIPPPNTAANTRQKLPPNVKPPTLQVPPPLFVPNNSSSASNEPRNKPPPIKQPPQNQPRQQQPQHPPVIQVTAVEEAEIPPPSNEQNEAATQEMPSSNQEDVPPPPVDVPPPITSLPPVRRPSGKAINTPKQDNFDVPPPPADQLPPETTSERQSPPISLANPPKHTDRKSTGQIQVQNQNHTHSTEEDFIPPPSVPPPVPIGVSSISTPNLLPVPHFLQHRKKTSGDSNETSQQEQDPNAPPTLGSQRSTSPPMPIVGQRKSSNVSGSIGSVSPKSANEPSPTTSSSSPNSTRPQSPKGPVIALPPPREILTVPDEISGECIKIAIELEEVFINALETLIECYKQPLLAKLGKLASQDLDGVFKDIEPLCTASKELLKRMKETSANYGWLACLYTDISSYLPAYRRFIASHAEGILRLNTLKGSNKPFAQALNSCHPDGKKMPLSCEIEDLFWMATSRVKQILQIAQAQRNHHHGLEQLATNVASATVFIQHYSVNPQPAVKPPPSEDVSKADEALKQISDLQLNAARLDELHSGLGVVRQIHTTSVDDIPANVNRKLAELVEVVLINKTEFGLSTEVPAILMFFNDGAALCLPLPPGDQHHKYQLLEWYKLNQLIVTDTQPKTKAATLRFARKVATSAVQALPPGWEEIVKGGKHTFTNKTLGVTQQQRPERISLCESVRELLMRTQELKDNCIKRFKELSGSDLTPEQKSPPYVMIGSNLESLMLHEQSLYPGLTVPIIVKKICHHIISHGIGEQGIFRVGGEKRFLEELRQQINSGHLDEIKFESKNINLISGLLKLFLRDMPQPLIPSDLYDAFLSVPGMPEPDQIPEIVKLLAKMPKENRDLMRELMSFEFQIACNEHVNSMTSSNLAIVTSPNILRRDGPENMLEVNQANGVVGTMIEKFLEVFEVNNSNNLSTNNENGQAQEWVSFKRKLLGHNKGIRMLIQSASGERMISIDGDGAIFVWSASKCRFIEQTALEVKYPNCAILVGENFWIGSQQGIFVYNSDTNALVSQIPRIVATSMLLVGNEVWAGSEGKIVVVSINDFKPIAELPEENGTMVFCLTLVGEFVWSAGFCKGKDQEIHVWDRFTRRRQAHFIAHKKRINSLSVHGGNVWSCSDDFSICVWNSTRFTRLATIERHQGAVYGFCVLPDQVWSCSWDKTIMIWEPNTFRCLGEIKGYHTDSVCNLVPVRRNDSTSVDIWSGSFDKALCVWSVRPAPTVVPLH